MQLRKALLVALLVWPATLFGQLPNLKPGWNLFSKEQDIQLGKEAAAQVEKQSQIINNPELTNYINMVGKRLAAQKQAGDFPFTFKVVNDSTINAFALPGGPAFVHTGLIKAVDNESELAGVLAHEMSHVALRHGTHQATTAQFAQLPAILAGAVFGKGILGTVAQAVGGLGANSLLLTFSRGSEKEADLLGAQIMNGAGYNPVEMAHFFEKLEKQSGKSGVLAELLSDHPSPGNRVKYIEEEVRYMPKHVYNADSGKLAHMQQIVASLPPAPAKGRAIQAPTAGAAGITGARPAAQLQQYQSSDFTMDIPQNWQALGDANSPSQTFGSRDGVFQDQSGNIQVGYGAMTNYYKPQAGGNVDLRRDTQDLIKQMAGQNQSMQVTRDPSAIKVGGADALQTMFSSPSPFQGQKEVDILVTVARPQGLLYIVFVAPEADLEQARGVFQDMLRSVKFR